MWQKQFNGKIPSSYRLCPGEDAVQMFEILKVKKKETSLKLQLSPFLYYYWPRPLPSITSFTPPETAPGPHRGPSAEQRCDWSLALALMRVSSSAMLLLLMMIIRPIQLVAFIFIFSLGELPRWSWIAFYRLWYRKTKLTQRILMICLLFFMESKRQGWDGRKENRQTCSCIKAAGKLKTSEIHTNTHTHTHTNWGREGKKERHRETRLPQQLCHYVGGNYESDENGEEKQICANALTLERERNCQLETGPHWQFRNLFKFVDWLSHKTSTHSGARGKTWGS